MAKTEITTRATTDIRLSPSTQAAIEKIEGILAESNTQIGQLGGGLTEAFVTARTMQAIREAITPEMMKDVMSLQGKRLGFRTDRDEKGGYSADVVRDCCIEGLMRGIRWVGNEMNIIAGNFYATREAFTRLLREFPGLSDLDINYSVPQVNGNRAIVQWQATWKLNVQPMEMSREIAIRVNAGMIDDAIIGKCERKAKRAIYERLTGSVLSDGEVGDGIQTLDAVPNATSKGPVKGSDLFASAKAEPPREGAAGWFADRLKAASSREEVAGIASQIKDAHLTHEEREQLRTLYAERNAALTE